MHFQEIQEHMLFSSLVRNEDSILILEAYVWAPTIFTVTSNSFTGNAVDNVLYMSSSGASVATVMYNSIYNGPEVLTHETSQETHMLVELL